MSFLRNNHINVNIFVRGDIDFFSNTTDSIYVLMCKILILSFVAGCTLGRYRIIGNDKQVKKYLLNIIHERNLDKSLFWN
jgi:hypothetical protein